uniref:Uncharacterized protein n=1 Tax=Oryza glumipatula TaxID=40148 RepID=A0A0E0AJ81_9ORYZ
MQSVPQEPPPVPCFGQNFCPQIYPFENQLLEFASGTPLCSLYCLQLTLSPLPPKFASKTVITCEPLMVCPLNINNELILTNIYVMGKQHNLCVPKN